METYSRRMNTKRESHYRADDENRVRCFTRLGHHHRQGQHHQSTALRPLSKTRNAEHRFIY